MTGPQFEPMRYANPTPSSKARRVTSTGVTYLGKPTFRLSPGTLTLSSPADETVEYVFNYAGTHGLLIVPFPGLFEPIDGKDMVFHLVNGDNPITLRSRQDIEDAGYKMDGSLEFPYSVYNYPEKTFVIGNSPPDMIVGP